LKLLVQYDELSNDEKKRLLDRMKSELEKPVNQSTLSGSSESAELATPGQIKYLRGLKYDGDPTVLTKFEASKKIKELTGEAD